MKVQEGEAVTSPGRWIPERWSRWIMPLSPTELSTTRKSMGVLVDRLPLLLRESLASGTDGSSDDDHYYRNADLSRLVNPCCPGFPTGNARPGQKGLVGVTNRDKMFFFLFSFS